MIGSYRNAIAAVLLAAFLAPALGGCWSEGKADTPGAEPYRHMAEVVTVREQAAYSVMHEYAGRVMAGQTSRLGFERGGQVEELLADEGETVAAGQVLARLDTALLEAEASELEAGAAELTAELDLARRNLERVARLREEQLASERERDELESRVRVLEASLQRVAAAQESNRVRLRQSELRAPFDARIGSREVDSGVVVAAGQDVFRLVDSARREVRAGIPLDEAARLEPGDRLPVRIGETLLNGTLITVGAEVDEATRSRSVRVSVEGVHAPGELAYLQLEEAIGQRGAWIPDTAVTEGLRGTWIAYTVVAEGDGVFRVEPRAVTIRHARAGELFVTGLEDGGRLIAGGLHRYAPGQFVRVTPARQLAGVREGA